MVQARHQATTVSQLRDFVGKIGGLQAEQRAVQLRKSGWDGTPWRCNVEYDSRRHRIAGNTLACDTIGNFQQVPGHSTKSAE